MIIQPVDVFLLVWCAPAGLSTAYVVDQFKNNPEPPVVKWGFIFVTLYMGPIGLLLYVLADKEPRPGKHEQFTAPLWKQGVDSAPCGWMKAAFARSALYHAGYMMTFRSRSECRTGLPCSTINHWTYT